MRRIQVPIRRDPPKSIEAHEIDFRDIDANEFPFAYAWELARTSEHIKVILGLWLAEVTPLGGKTVRDCLAKPDQLTLEELASFMFPPLRSTHYQANGLPAAPKPHEVLG